MKGVAPIAPAVQRRKDLQAGAKYTDISDAGHPAGAEGCGKCRYGLLGDTRTNGPAPLYALRIEQARAGTIQFCDCAAGAAYRSYLLIMWRKEKELPVASYAVGAWLEAA
jgi:hypothetical protein